MAGDRSQRHVLWVPSWYPSAQHDVAGSFFREQAIAVSDTDCQVGVIAPRQRSLRLWRQALGEPRFRTQLDSGVRTLRWDDLAWLPKIPHANRALWVVNGLRLYHRYCAEHGVPDLLHAHSILNGGLLAFAIHAAHGLPYVITEHSTAFSRGILRPSERRLAASVSARAGRRIAVSTALCRDLARTLGPRAGRWQPLPNIVSKRFARPPLASRRPGPNFVWLVVASLRPKKGIDTLVRAFARVCRNSSTRPARLRIGGQGPDRSRLEALAGQLRIRDRVEFLGGLTREQVAAELERADAFVLPSRHETFGVVLVEALSRGLPVVSTLSGGPESIITPGDGLLVPVDDPPALSHAMRHVQDHRAEFDDEGIRRRCLERFSEQVVCTRLRSIYDEVVG